MKKLALQHINLIKYFLIGLSAAAIDLVIYLILFNFALLAGSVSTIISSFIANIYGFLMNAFLNFKTQDRLVARFISYTSVTGVGIATSAAMLFILTDTVGLNGNLIKILTLPLIFLIQYTLNKKFSFSFTQETNDTEEQKKTSIITAQKKARIAVIGGGFTGLASAYDLARAGYDVTILERNDHVGGLASGFTLDGYPLERAYHFIYQSDNHIIEMADELGIKNAITFYPSSISFFCEGKHYPFGTPKDLLLFKPLSFINRIRAGITALFLQKTNNWRALSTITAYDWLQKWAGPEVTRIIWEPLLRGKFDRYYDKVTMSWLWGRLKIRAKSQNRDMSGEKLGYITGGFDKIVEGMKKEILSHGGEIRLKTPTTALQKNNDGTITVITETTQETFDSVLVTTPSPVFARMIEKETIVPQEYKSKLNSIDYLGAIVMVFNTTQEISKDFWYNIKDDRIPFLTMLSTTALTGPEMFGNTYVYYVGAYVPAEHRYFSMSESEIMDEWDTGIAIMFPEYRTEDIRDRKVFKFKDAQHIVDIGYEEKKLLPFETPIPGVFLSNFSQIYPDDRGTNFAIRDGRRVAKKIATYISENNGK